MLVFPKGATVLDFAYGIHSDLGNHCIGAIVNPTSIGESKKRVPRERQLFTGEALQIITDPGVHPHESWLGQVKTTKSRSQIKKALEQQKEASARNSGRALLERKLREKGETHGVENWLNSENVKYALNEENLSANKFLQEIGLQKRPLQKFLRKYNLLDFKQTGRLKGMINYDVWTKLFGGEKNVFMIEDIRNPLIRMANCCFPIPGDKIKGFIHDDKEIEIHHAECVKVSSKKYKTQHGNIAVNVAWKLSEKITQSHIIHLDVVDGTGILFEITKIIKDAGVTIINSRTSARNNNEADIRIEIESITWPVFHKIVEKLRSLKFVKKIWEETPVAG